MLAAAASAHAQQTAVPKAKLSANRLAKETSPYLLLHAHNPVDWYPWGPEAFARAKAENKPIFLSIGYSSCYWCHVMERESFTDPEVARAMNQNFVCVKVDREERPDVDQVYMSALQAFGAGGWPMSMFLTPDGRPFYGGTYFPPRDRDGFTGFLTVLTGVAKSWKEERNEIERAANGLSQVVRRVLETTGPRAKAPLSRAMVTEARTRLAQQFDPEYGGFGYNPENPRRPKFPEPVNLLFLLDQHRRDAKVEKPETIRQHAPPATPKGTDPLAMVLFTMDRMQRGGIRDHIGGGYHRYATSRYWIVPHFEKMLYDNAQLASAHLAAFELTRDRRWKDEAESTLSFVARSMTSPDGGFYSALDAETEGEEGAYYVWTLDELREALGEGPASESFLQIYGMKREPNFTERRYVLLEPRRRAEQAESLKTTPDALEASLKPLREKILAVRDRRPAPLRDDKILTAWNGLMIAAYADAARLLGRPEYRKPAEQAADFVWSKLRTPEGRLLRSYRDGQAKLAGYLEDYAFLTHGLLKLHAATGDPNRLRQARELTDRMIADFGDPKEGGFYFTAEDHESLLARPKDPFDNALPSANGVAVLNLLALARLTGESRYLDQAENTLKTFANAMTQNPAALPTMLVGLEAFLDVRPSATPLKALVDGGLANPPGDIVTASANWADGQTVEPGRELKIRVKVVIRPGWHIQANPSGSELLKPTMLTLMPGESATLSKVEYPAGQAKILSAVAKEKILLYEGEVEIAANVKFEGAAPTVRLEFQPCNDRACLAPAELDIPITTGKTSGQGTGRQ
jgi:uncharacterized protein YyaL (SSP411 family)